MAGWRDPNEAYLILQTIVGAWPLTPERLELYLEKALREAKVNTNWIDQDHEWEGGRKGIRGLLAGGRRVAAYVEAIRERAKRSVLATTCQADLPGVPDIYQGDELPYFALVDPDNRRPVDWELRRRLLAASHRRSST